MNLKNLSIGRARGIDLRAVKLLEAEAGLSPWDESEYVRELGRPDSFFWVAKIGSQFAGFILARLITTKPFNLDESLFGDHPADSKVYPEKSAKSPEKTAEKEIEIYNLAVKSEFQGFSIGSGLLSKILDEALTTERLKIFLEVRQSNAKALEFYRKHGFQVIGERRNFYRNPSEDAVLLGLSIGL